MYKAFILAAIILAAAVSISAQNNNTVRVAVKNKDTNEPVAAAAIKLKNSDISVSTDADGNGVLTNIPYGPQTLVIEAIGFEELEVKKTFPISDEVLNILLELHHEVGSVTISTTRTGREIEAEPSRVEAIDEEEMDEKINMRPANVSMVLHESTGIQVQQTSATSSTQSISIQGLGGRYTQILKDGFPSYGGFSGSLSVLEIPPLDLKQVEVIKGPAATFYGGDAIAGVVNFISKMPDEKPVTYLLFNQTSAGGTDMSVFNSQKFDRIGYTLLGSLNLQRPFDVDKDDFTELPRTVSFAINPRVFFYPDDKTSVMIGNSTSHQNRKGGDIFAVRGEMDKLHSYFEKNASTRNITTFSFDRNFDDGTRINAKQSIAFFDRELTTPGDRFAGSQFNSFSEASYYRAIGKHALVLGGSVLYDRFREDGLLAPDMLRDETRTAVGAFIQDTVDISDRISVEAGFRLEHAGKYGTFALPRVSLLYRFSDELTTRIGGGFGYKAPTIFTEDSERLLFRNVLRLGEGLKAEKSRGGTFDINYRKELSEKLNVSLNQMFFYTQISDPISMRQRPDESYEFVNETSSVTSKGFETNLRIGYGIAKLFAGYTFTDAKAGYLPGDRRLTLLPRSMVNSSLVFEEHGNFKVGVEYYYKSRQTLEDRSRTPSTWEAGLFAEKTFGKFSFFINAENVFDERQSKYGPVVFPPHDMPTFAEIWTHTEGRVINGGVKIRL
ncbi:MAG: TonB-dependent receptor [Acidobacteria bacterium]|nr:TonB-dependent receptor [Acidobacteriota bacterium]